MNLPLPFSKPPLNVDEHLTMLQQRGLSIPDETVARQYLCSLGYYRLRGYFIPFQEKDDANHTFLPGTTFETVLRHYNFDRELRLLVLDALERIEIAFKAAISDRMCVRYGPQWYTDKCFFSYKSRFGHIDHLIAVRGEIQTHDKHACLSHYYKK